MAMPRCWVCGGAAPRTILSRVHPALRLARRRCSPPPRPRRAAPAPACRVGGAWWRVFVARSLCASRPRRVGTRASLLLRRRSRRRSAPPAHALPSRGAARRSLGQCVALLLQNSPSPAPPSGWCLTRPAMRARTKFRATCSPRARCVPRLSPPTVYHSKRRMTQNCAGMAGGQRLRRRGGRCSASAAAAAAARTAFAHRESTARLLPLFVLLCATPSLYS